MPIKIESIIKGAGNVVAGAVKNTIKDKVDILKNRLPGPLAVLEENKYSSGNSLQYPLDLAKYPHWIKFNINIPEKSKYKKEMAASDAYGSGVANANKAAQLGNAVNAFGGNMASVKAGVGGGIIAGIASKAGSILKAAVKGKGMMAAGAAAAGAAKGGVMGAMVSAVTSERQTKRTVQTIFLYVPDTIQNQITATFDSVSLTEAMGNAGLIAQGADAAGATIKNAWENKTLGAGMTSKDALGAISAEAAVKAAGADAGLQSALLKRIGVAQNPQIDVIFKSIANREFQFDFKFTPTSQEEAEEVLKIINRFRFHAAPELIESEGATRYLIPPSEFDIEICFRGEHNRAIHKISTCVLEGIDVNYVTAGQWATFEDGMPVEVALQLRFKEVEIMHKKLIEEGY